MGWPKPSDQPLLSLYDLQCCLKSLKLLSLWPRCSLYSWLLMLSVSQFEQQAAEVSLLSGIKESGDALCVGQYTGHTITVFQLCHQRNFCCLNWPTGQPKTASGWEEHAQCDATFKKKLWAASLPSFFLRPLASTSALNVSIYRGTHGRPPAPGVRSNGPLKLTWEGTAAGR